MSPASHEAQQLADAWVAHSVVQREAATHIALAVVNRIEFLVTWDFKHIASAALRSKIGNACIAAGYAAPTICTPEQLGATMTNDPIVAEIRKIRDEHAAKFNYDIAAICEDFHRSAKESGRQYVTYPPRRPEPPVEVSSLKAKPKRRKKRAAK